MEEVGWQDNARCKEFSRNLFFEIYEGASVSRRESIKDICRSCPVKKECLAFGIATRSEGVFGGEYLKTGKPYHGLVFS